MNLLGNKNNEGESMNLEENGINQVSVEDNQIAESTANVDNNSLAEEITPTNSEIVNPEQTVIFSDPQNMFEDTKEDEITQMIEQAVSMGNGTSEIAIQEETQTTETAPTNETMINAIPSTEENQNIEESPAEPEPVIDQEPITEEVVETAPIVEEVPEEITMPVDEATAFTENAESQTDVPIENADVVNTIAPEVSYEEPTELATEPIYGENITEENTEQPIVEEQAIIEEVTPIENSEDIQDITPGEAFIPAEIAESQNDVVELTSEEPINQETQNDEPIFTLSDEQNASEMNVITPSMIEGTPEESVYEEQTNNEYSEQVAMEEQTIEYEEPVVYEEEIPTYEEASRDITEAENSPEIQEITYENNTATEEMPYEETSTEDYYNEAPQPEEYYTEESIVSDEQPVALEEEITTDEETPVTEEVYSEETPTEEYSVEEEQQVDEVQTETSEENEDEEDDDPVIDLTPYLQPIGDYNEFDFDSENEEEQEDDETESSTDAEQEMSIAPVESTEIESDNSEEPQNQSEAIGQNESNETSIDEEVAEESEEPQSEIEIPEVQEETVESPSEVSEEPIKPLIEEEEIEIKVAEPEEPTPTEDETSKFESDFSGFAQFINDENGELNFENMFKFNQFDDDEEYSLEEPTTNINNEAEQNDVPFELSTNPFEIESELEEPVAQIENIEENNENVIPKIDFDSLPQPTLTPEYQNNTDQNQEKVTIISEPTKAKFCNNCGTMVTDNSNICPSCGNSLI